MKYLASKRSNLVLPFYLKADDYVYDVAVNNPNGKDCYLPLEIDTEYKILDYDLNFPHQLITDILTVQIRSINVPVGRIYSHPNTKSNHRHQRFYSGLSIVQYLRDLGYEADITRNVTVDITSTLPTIQLDLYAFFALVDINKIATNGYRDDIVKLAINHTNNGIKMERRLRATTKVKGKVTDFCYMDWMLTINEEKYAVKLSIKDTSAVHGKCSYADFCRNSNVDLPYKDTFTNDEKSRMDEMCKTRPIDFDNYALGDLYNHDALMGNREIFHNIYKVLSIEKGFTSPKLTIGSTINNFITTFINSEAGHMPLDDKKFVNGFCKPSSTVGLEHLKTLTSGLCLKVDGGRCRNNRPTDIVVEGALCDLDISGAYTESMREQIYPVGVPVVIDYEPKSLYNEYQTLREFMKSYGKELVPGLWVARVSLKPDYLLTNPQDFFTSWKPPKNLYDLVTDTVNLEDDKWWDNVDNIGVTKILNHEITNAVINHDSYQWIMNVASQRQRKELLDNLLVHAVIYYPNSERVEASELLVDAHKNWKGRNTTSIRKVKGKSTKIVVRQECHKWFGIPLVKALNILGLERKKHPKKTPENKLFKLTINTVYGVEVSPFFTISNVVVGNNITARVRTLAWCMEKGLNGFQSITDGCAFDMNKVITTIKKSGSVIPLSSSKLTNIKQIVNSSNAMYTSLNLDSCYNEIKLSDNGQLMFIGDNQTRILNKKESLEWINKSAMSHLKSLFKGLDVLHKETVDIYGNKRTGLFEFEAKGFYSKATFQGSANYMLEYDGVKQVKYRSYPKKPVKKIDYIDVDSEKLLKRIDISYQPAQEFLERLSTPNQVPRSNAFLQERILKVDEYRKDYKKWERSQVVWSDTIEKVRLLKEFSLTQFTYQTFEQLQAWEREYNQLIRKYGQSYEMFYLNADGTLNFQKMILDIDTRIKRGDMGFFDGVDRHAENTYRSYSKHPAKECQDALKQMLLWRYKLTSAPMPYKTGDIVDDDHEQLVSEY